MITNDQLEKWLTAPSENEHLEFKEARNRYDFEKLVSYCAALANEGGEHMILGVTDRLPRQVVGTAAFENVERTNEKRWKDSCGRPYTWGALVSGHRLGLNGRRNLIKPNSNLIYSSNNLLN